MNAYTISFSKNIGRQFENFIYLELRRMGCSIFYYLTQERNEVDFMAIHPNGQSKLFQVSWDVDSKQTLKREMTALTSAMDELKIKGELVTPESYLNLGITFS